MQDQTSQLQKLLKIIPLDYVLKFDPPIIGLVYKINENEPKKRLYQIYLRELILHNDVDLITEKLFEEHKLHLNPSYVSVEQIKTLVTKLLDHLNKKRLLTQQSGKSEATKGLTTASTRDGASNSSELQKNYPGTKFENNFEYESFDNLAGEKGSRSQAATDDRFGSQDFRISNDGMGETSNKKAESSSKYKVANPKNLLAADDLGIDLDEDFEIDEFDGF